MAKKHIETETITAQQLNEIAEMFAILAEEFREASTFVRELKEPLLIRSLPTLRLGVKNSRIGSDRVQQAIRNVKLGDGPSILDEDSESKIREAITKDVTEHAANKAAEKKSSYKKKKGSK